MKSILLLCCLFISLIQIQAQSISKQIVGSSGQSLSNGTFTVNFTAGESIVGMVQNGATIQQGFWAELTGDSTLSIETPIENIHQVKFFPNPVIDYLQIRFKENKSVNYSIAIHDINGKQIIQTKIKSNNNNQIDISSLSSGIYVLSISSTETNYQNSFKIVKK